MGNSQFSEDEFHRFDVRDTLTHGFFNEHSHLPITGKLFYYIAFERYFSYALCSVLDLGHLQETYLICVPAIMAPFFAFGKNVFSWDHSIRPLEDSCYSNYSYILIDGRLWSKAQ